MKLPFRAHQWYFFLLPPIAAIMLISGISASISLYTFLQQAGLLILSAIGTAAFGFFINVLGCFLSLLFRG